MKVVFADVQSREKDSLSGCVPKKDIRMTYEPLNPENASSFSEAEIACVSIHSRINKEAIGKMPNLKYVITRSTGFDHIDIAECKKRKIKVLNVPAYGTHTVAEHTFALLLALTRRIPQAIERAREGKWDVEGLLGTDLHGKTIGIVGLGKIGKDVAIKAKAFGMDIIALSPDKDMKFAKKVGLKYVNLDYLLRNSDVISIHAPLTSSTKQMINLKNISLVKKGAYLVNTARGEIVDGAALIEALDCGQLAGAALDVLEDEKDIIEEAALLKSKKLGKADVKQIVENHMLMHERNVIVTPHTAYYTSEALGRILSTTCDNIKSCLRNKPINLVR